MLRNVYCGTYFTHVQTYNNLTTLEAPFERWRLQAPFKPPLSTLQGEAPFKPPSSPLEASFKVKPPSSFLKPLDAPLKPPWSFPRWSTLRPSDLRPSPPDSSSPLEGGFWRRYLGTSPSSQCRVAWTLKQRRSIAATFKTVRTSILWRLVLWLRWMDGWKRSAGPPWTWL